ncbi:type I restriction-modification system subunit M [Helicobacter sp. 11S03491-1]|uniref:type I restriction-modification system subunit M n=1 Tax=Helicobacter sp. 11S03491-1 TaxID=1476196 RepID=UPI000BA6FE65|nr:type I restriction-modification system subunit M [Helicobacter sp. 11S03491-1]PAF41581.1 type I restriction-modification system subunit M [Helicobacter sp. 11S03491-1]
MESVQQRAKLHRAIWKIAEDLRGSVDGWDFKTYVLGFLFYRFICENLKTYIKEEFPDVEDYSKIEYEQIKSYEDDIIDDKGFFISPEDLFENILKEIREDHSKLENLNMRLKEAFDNIENSCKGKASEDNFKDLFKDKDIDVNSAKLGNSNIERNKKLLKIMESINALELDYSNNKIDAFGDAYEFLMMMYASNAGRSGGEFFTPQEVSRLLVEITLSNKGIPNKVYDPACGSGSLLLQYKKSLKQDPKLGYFGQEENITTYNLARMNMFLHNVGYEKFHIAHGDTLVNPCEKHKNEEPFDAIVSNPPYSKKWEGKNNPILINDDRFSRAGVLAPTSKADLAFVMHILSWLSEKGSAAIVCFPGVLHRRGAEEKIRGYLVDNNYVDCIISLSDNLFFGTSIAVCIMVLRKNKQDNNTLFINASKEYIKVTNKNMLTEENIQNILSLYKKRENIDYLCSLADKGEIKANNYNLSVSSYIESEDTRQKVDIKSLNKEIEEIVKRQSELRIQIDSIVMELEKIS